LGVLDKLKASRCVRKVGVQFVNAVGQESAPFFFYEHDPRESSVTWHVQRDEFDQMLFENAAERGAICRDGTRVLDVRFDGDRAVGVRLQPAEGATLDVAARVVVDATGIQSLLANKLALKQVNPELRKAAIWHHFRGGHRDDQGGGFKTVIMHTHQRKSWFWYIPQSDDVVSVGVVGDRDYLLKGRGTPAEVFWQEVELCPKLGEWLADAEPVDEVSVAKEYSYTTSRSAGDGWVLVGDAWGFIDPLYSSGVYFALQSGSMAADCIVEALKSGDTSAAVLGRWLEEFNRQTKLIRLLVQAFYTGEFRVGQFVREYPQHKKELVDLLIGRIFDGRRGRIFDDLEPWLRERIQVAR
jgi:flavin-dependent dehydrogenase